MTDPDLRTLGEQLSDAAQDGFNHGVGLLAGVTKFTLYALAWILIATGKFLITAEAHIADRKKRENDGASYVSKL
jgi:hypothetical protein